MKTITAIAANKLGNFVTRDFRQIFGSACDDEAERIGSAARSTIEMLGGGGRSRHRLFASCRLLPKSHGQDGE